MESTGSPSNEEGPSDVTRTLAAAFLHVRVGEILPYLADVVSNASITRTRYRARCPVCQEHTFEFAQGRNGIMGMACEAGCPMEGIAAALIERRLAAGEHPENVWGRADRALRGENWNL